MKKDFKLSEHFSFYELTNTSDKELLEVNRVSAEQYIKPLTDLCNNILEPIRHYVNCPVIISSGYRCPELNNKQKGSKTSQHLKGEAVDIVIPGKNLEEVYNYIKDKLNIKYGQLILEFRKYPKAEWIHVSLGVPYREAEKSNTAFIMNV